MNIAVIPARGGSKRIPKKNIRTFAGRPMIVHSIQAAQSSGLFQEIIVSTDCPDIADVAREAGARVPFMRPAELSDDFTPTVPVVAHAVRWLHQQEVPVSHVCCIYATAPFLEPDDLRRGLALLREHQASYAFSVTRFSFPIQRALKINEHYRLQSLFPGYELTRSQDLEPVYHDAGQFYWGTAKAYMDELPLYAAHSVPVILPEYRVQDIDTLDDWRRAELMYVALQRSTLSPMESAT